MSLIIKRLPRKRILGTLMRVPWLLVPCSASGAAMRRFQPSGAQESWGNCPPVNGIRWTPEHTKFGVSVGFARMANRSKMLSGNVKRKTSSPLESLVTMAFGLLQELVNPSSMAPILGTGGSTLTIHALPPTIFLGHR